MIWLSLAVAALALPAGVVGAIAAADNEDVPLAGPGNDFTGQVPEDFYGYEVEGWGGGAERIVVGQAIEGGVQAVKNAGSGEGRPLQGYERTLVINGPNGEELRKFVIADPLRQGEMLKPIDDEVFSTIREEGQSLEEVSARMMREFKSTRFEGTLALEALDEHYGRDGSTEEALCSDDNVPEEFQDDRQRLEEAGMCDVLRQQGGGADE